ncbi:hypothetical protein PDE_08753 [Penicillium oxalicum 114-2]|uniref:Nuclear membrane fusion protein Kar5 n=1 Tax=Penicillium oxalicum (strain 114-2 / CGMCC 5302) TaxID=933388 RepID=S7ZYB4_PENO1|nr:hypothetical protein PDE_08753 [Penicillium oxalicum 114-2]
MQTSTVHLLLGLALTVASWAGASSTGHELGGKANSDPEVNQKLNMIRSIYAARLAICELEGASTLIPQPCIAITAPIRTPSTSGFGFLRKSTSHHLDEKKLPKRDLELCLKALESRPQWWTSYSNNRQNAIVICQASRAETEKEEILGLHHSLTESTIKLNEGLQEALHQAEKTAAEHQAFLQKVLVLQEQAMKEMEEKGTFIGGAFDKLLRKIEDGFDCVGAAVTTTLGKLHMESSILKQDLKNSSSHAKALHEILLATHKDVITRSHQVAQMQAHDSIVAKAMTSDLQNSLRSLAEADVAQLSQQMAIMDQALEWLNNRLIVAIEQENKLAERLRAMDSSVNQAQLKAEELQHTQQLQVEQLLTQQQTQESIRFNAQVSQALLDKATNTAANLHTLLDEAAIKIKQTPGLHQSGLSGWTLCFMILLLVGVQNFKAAFGLVFFILGHLIATTIFPLFKVYRSSLGPL